MKSKIEEAAIRALIAGSLVNKFVLVKEVGCTPISAQRMLISMHKAGVMRISGWTKSGVRNVPHYKADGKKDVPRPPQVSQAQRCRDRYAKNAVDYVVKQQAYRLVKKIKEKKFGYETNPYRELYRIAVQRSDRVCD